MSWLTMIEVFTPLKVDDMRALLSLIACFANPVYLLPLLLNLKAVPAPNSVLSIFRPA